MTKGIKKQWPRNGQEKYRKTKKYVPRTANPLPRKVYSNNSYLRLSVHPSTSLIFPAYGSRNIFSARAYVIPQIYENLEILWWAVFLNAIFFVNSDPIVWGKFYSVTFLCGEELLTTIFYRQVEVIHDTKVCESVICHSLSCVSFSVIIKWYHVQWTHPYELQHPHWLLSVMSWTTWCPRFT